MDNTTQDSRVSPAMRAAALRSATMRAAQYRLDGLQQTPRPVAEINLPLPSYQTSASGSTIEPPILEVSAEEAELLEGYREVQKMVYYQSFPSTQYKVQVTEEHRRIETAVRNGISKTPLGVPITTVARDEVKKRWIEQGIWNEKWQSGKLWIWKHEEPPEPDSELQAHLTIAADYRQSGAPRPDEATVQKEAQRLANKRAVRDREREASRPFSQFIYQILRQREWIEEQATAQGAAALNSADIYSRAYEETRDLWKKRGIWNKAWTLMPGIAWAHESPIDVILNEGIDEYLASIRAKKLESEKAREKKPSPVMPPPVPPPDKPKPALSKAEQEKQSDAQMMRDAIQSGIDPTRAAQLVDDLQRIRAHRRSSSSSFWQNDEPAGKAAERLCKRVPVARQEPPSLPSKLPPRPLPPAIPESSQPQHPPTANPHPSESSQPPPPTTEPSQPQHSPTTNLRPAEPNQVPSLIAEPTQPESPATPNPPPTDQNQSTPSITEPLRPGNQTIHNPPPAELNQLPSLIAEPTQPESPAAPNPPPTDQNQPTPSITEPLRPGIPTMLNPPHAEPNQVPSPIAEPTQPEPPATPNPPPTDQNQPVRLTTEPCRPELPPTTNSPSAEPNPLPPLIAESPQPESPAIPDPPLAELNQTPPQPETAAAPNPPEVVDNGHDVPVPVPEPSPQPSPPRVKRRPGRPAGVSKRAQPNPPSRESDTRPRRSRRIQEAAHAMAADTSRAPTDSGDQPPRAKRGRPRASSQAPPSSSSTQVARGAKRQRLR